MVMQSVWAFGRNASVQKLSPFLPAKGSLVYTCRATPVASVLAFDSERVLGGSLPVWEKARDAGPPRRLALLLTLLASR
jgi:hypothetical protein